MGSKVNQDSPCSDILLDEADSEHVEQIPTILLDEWLREHRQTGGDDLRGEGSGSEDHLGETMPLEMWISIQEGAGGEGGPTQQSVGGVRLEDKQDSAVATDAPGEVSIGSGVDGSRSAIKEALNSWEDKGDKGSGRGGGDGGFGGGGGYGGSGEEERGGEGGPTQRSVGGV